MMVTMPAPPTPDRSDASEHSDTSNDSNGSHPSDVSEVSDKTIGGRDLTTWPTRGGQWLVRIMESVARLLRPVATRITSWSAPRLAFIAFAVASLVVMALLVEGVETVYEAVKEQDGIAGLDQPVLDAMVGVRSGGFNTVVTWFTNIGGPVGMPILATAAVVLIALHRRRWTPVVLAVVAAAGSLAMTVVGKDMIDRARPPASFAVPPLEISPSFPSGHALNATVLTTIVVYLLLIESRSVRQRSTAIGLGTLFVVLMGLSRVYLGHHWLTDVVAGWLLGFGWALAVITAHRLWLTLRPNSGAPA